MRVVIADVARVLVALLYEARTCGHTLELVGGDLPIADALAAVAG
jgi:hypothetical protein